MHLSKISGKGFDTFPRFSCPLNPRMPLNTVDFPIPNKDDTVSHPVKACAANRFGMIAACVLIIYLTLIRFTDELVDSIVNASKLAIPFEPE